MRCDDDCLETSKFIFGGDNVVTNNNMVHSNVTFAENASFSISNNDNTYNQSSNLPNNKDKNLVNSDNNSCSVATGNSIFSNLLYKVSDFVNSPSPETLKKFAYQTFEKFASTLPPSADLVPPPDVDSDDSDYRSDFQAEDEENPYNGIFK